MQLGFNLSNGVTDTLESSTILIYFVQVKGTWRNVLIKTELMKYKERIMVKLNEALSTTRWQYQSQV